MGSVGAARRTAGQAGRIIRSGVRRGARLARQVDARVGAPFTVLAYHRVADTDCDPWNLKVSPQHFDEQVACLRASGDPVRLTDALGRGRSARAWERTSRFAVTFDDGYVDNLVAALPTLERHDVPATVFIPTAFIGKRSFWWDRLDLLVMASTVPLPDLVDAFAAEGLAGAWVRSAAFDDRLDFHERVHDDVTDLDPDAIEERLDHAVERLRVDEAQPDGRPMTVDELTTLAAHPLITIGAHTANHRMLPKLDGEGIAAELEAGTGALDALFGPQDRVLAYPHGRTDRRVAALVRKAGFRHAFTTAGRVVSRIDPPRRLPRVNPTDLDGSAFADWLQSPS